jgi:hypothetical protein
MARPPNHGARIKENPMWDAPVAWPHDGGRGAGILTSETATAIYKKLGLAMRPTHATFPDGGYNFEAGIMLMEERLVNKKLLVAEHLYDWFGLSPCQWTGQQGRRRPFERDARRLHGSAVCQDGRQFRAPLEQPGPQIARGVDFDLFTGQ